MSPECWDPYSRQAAKRRAGCARASPSGAAGRFVTRVSTNLLRAFARGPARGHYPPAQDNLGDLA